MRIKNINFKKIILLITIIFCLSLALLIYKYQQLVDKGTLIADEECLKVNPLLIQRKNDYLDSMKIIQASGSASEYWKSTQKYVNDSKKFIIAQGAWLAEEKNYINDWQFKLFAPSIIQKVANDQYISREADLNTSDALVQMFSNPKGKDLTQYVMDQVNVKNKADDNFDKDWKSGQKTNDLRIILTKVPPTKCPDNLLNIPDTSNPFPPPSIPSNAAPDAG